MVRITRLWASWKHAQNGLYRVDAAARNIEKVAGADTRRVSLIYARKDGWLVGVQNGLFRVDSAARSVENVRQADSGAFERVNDRSTLGLLIGGTVGLVLAVDNFNGAKITPLNRDRFRVARDIVTRWSLRHDCSRAAKTLQLCVAA
jgi:hypothetical protein